MLKEVILERVSSECAIECASDGFCDQSDRVLGRECLKHRVHDLIAADGSVDAPNGAIHGFPKRCSEPRRQCLIERVVDRRPVAALDGDARARGLSAGCTTIATARKRIRVRRRLAKRKRERYRTRGGRYCCCKTTHH